MLDCSYVPVLPERHIHLLIPERHTHPKWLPPKSRFRFRFCPRLRSRSRSLLPLFTYIIIIIPTFSSSPKRIKLPPTTTQLPAILLPIHIRSRPRPRLVPSKREDRTLVQRRLGERHEVKDEPLVQHARRREPQETPRHPEMARPRRDDNRQRPSGREASVDVVRLEGVEREVDGFENRPVMRE